MPPWFLVKGKYHMESWYKTTSLPHDYTIATTPNGYTTNKIGVKWIESFAEASKSRVKVGEKRLLLMDNYHSHCTPEFIKVAIANNIIPYCFIPHTTHLCQPLDSTPFLTLKNIFKSHNNEIVQWCGNVDRKVDFFREIQLVRDALTSRIIKSGFQKCGIIPFDPSIVLTPLEKRN